MSREKLFPLRLPQNYHGNLKHFDRPTEKYIKKLSNKEEFDAPSTKIVKWQRKIKDSDIIQEKKEFLVHPAKISQDNPDWLKNTTHYFHRSQFLPFRKESNADRKQFDVLGNRKVSHIASKSEAIFEPKQFRRYREVTPKIGHKTTSLYKYKQTAFDVPQKIGHTDLRNIVVKKPQLKVGSSQANNFIDTYTVN